MVVLVKGQPARTVSGVMAVAANKAVEVADGLRLRQARLRVVGRRRRARLNAVVVDGAVVMTSSLAYSEQV